MILPNRRLTSRFLVENELMRHYSSMRHLKLILGRCQLVERVCTILSLLHHIPPTLDYLLVVLLDVRGDVLLET